MPADASEPDVDPAEVAALLSVPPEEFVAARTARAKELRAEGRRPEAAALAKVRKPVRLVWVVGELARRNPQVAAAAATVAEQVEEAMGGGGGVRQLLTRFREVVGEVAALADELDGTVDRLQVGLALREVLGDPTAREAWVEGRLLALPGDEDVAAPPDELAERRRARAAGAPAAPGGADADADAGAGDETADEAAAREAAELEVARAEERERAEEDLRTAEADVEETHRAHDEVTSALADLEARLAELEAEVASARDAHAASGDEVAAADARVVEARSALTALDQDGPPAGRPRRRRR